MKTKNIGRFMLFKIKQNSKIGLYKKRRQNMGLNESMKRGILHKNLSEDSRKATGRSEVLIPGYKYVNECQN